MITFDDFKKIEISVGTIKEVKDFPQAHKPAYQLTIDFGAKGIKHSSAQITKLYKKDKLIGKQIIAVTNFPVKQIANFNSECLVLGVVGEDSEIILLQPERKVKEGLPIG